ncbi:MAG: sulfotransferase [Pseudomonadota bacterium]
MKPNLFLIAAPRSGSTQLSAWLSSHPDIALPPIKEPNYFAAHEFPEDYVRQHHLSDVDVARYVQSGSRKQMQFAIFRTKSQYDYLFEGLNTPYRVDASTTYLHCPEAPAAILAFAPDAKVILLTRDPVARALSHYKLAVRTGRVTQSLRHEIEAEVSKKTPLPGRFLLRQSRYADAIARYKAIFDPANVMEIAFEDMIANPNTTLDRVSTFLDIPSDQFDLSIDSQNAGDSPRFRALNVWLMKSGLKSALRRHLPIWVKHSIKSIYFKSNTETFTDEDIALLKEHI